LELGQLAYIFIRSNDRPGGAATAEKLAAIPELLELHHVAGEDCFLAKVRARDAEALGRLLRERLGRITTITSTRTTIVLEVVKETSALPLRSESERREAAAHV
ncbi:MAG: Lrp/AsnC ligand binding domain-containing protein, partial [Acidobacteriota bacterium]|nr:Lrp/AsnC ligand binding domain-containing protein [Acidobacteriota bacterium]